MNWEEMIQRRRQKETQVNCLLDPRVSSNLSHTLWDQFFESLSHLEEIAIILRFVDLLPIARVAERMGMSWEGANQLIDRAVNRIQTEFS